MNNGKYIYVPCGRCAWCRRNKRQEWVIRFKEEAKSNKFTKFITLTYSDDNLPLWFDEETGECAYRCRVSDVQKFVKRMRKRGFKFKYFIVSEYAPVTLRPHLHGLLFTDDDISDKELRKSWQQGNTSTENAGEQSFSYVTKYILKGNERDGNFMLCSKRPSIGHGYIKRANIKQLYTDNGDGIKSFYYTTNGKKMPMPRYYKKKLKEFISEIDYDINTIKLIHEMEQRPKHYYLEKKYAKNNAVDFTNVIDTQRFTNSISAAYIRDIKQQYSINNKKEKIWNL